ncbi:AP-3 complex subunit sigma-2 [Cryptotermes secundus]|uniref:AP-3 complex subunit sigma-2 n=1 Tax=Cryptotermes secundus TaxID=105785 RepID=A0A2J7QZ89_9NEOP|nr:AP-3 complex subunit sigma-2 [Cryptotermes secundus]
MQQQIIKETFQLVSKRDDNVCNFLEGGSLIGGSDYKLIYRHYATLYFVFCVDSSESELGILDLIQVFVETLDKCFENVCELDLIFHVDKVHYILNELVMGGMVLETNMTEILTRIEDQNKLEKQEMFNEISKIYLKLYSINGHQKTNETCKIMNAFGEYIYSMEYIFPLLCSFLHMAGIAAAPARAVSAVKNMNIPQQIKDMKLPDLPQAIKDLKF